MELRKSIFSRDALTRYSTSTIIWGGILRRLTFLPCPTRRTSPPAGSADSAEMDIDHSCAIGTTTPSPLIFGVRALSKRFSITELHLNLNLNLLGTTKPALRSIHFYRGLVPHMRQARVARTEYHELSIAIIPNASAKLSHEARDL